MTTRILTTTLVLGLLPMATAPAAAQRWDRPPRDGACFYRDADFRGERICVPAGEDVGSLPWGLNDEVSSIQLFGRADVTVYGDRDFRGRTTRFGADVRDLEHERWNDRVSSIRVDRRGSAYRPDDDRGVGRRQAEDMVRRAYVAVLDREPDAEGVRIYTRRVLVDGWREDDVREALRDSPEFREKTRMTRPRAEEVVGRAYRAVLAREPDAGSRGYVERVMRDGWTQQDVERELRRSAEYRGRR